MKEKRIYQRYMISDEESKKIRDEIKLDGAPVQLVDFSLGGLCVLSERVYAAGDVVSIYVNFAKGGRIDLSGKVVRVVKDGSSWSVAVDLSGTYKNNPQAKP